MSNITDINTTQTRIARLLSSATPASIEPPKSKISLNTILLISIICTLLPLQAATTFFPIRRTPTPCTT